jgi:hypothetical protein
MRLPRALVSLLIAAPLACFYGCDSGYPVVWCPVAGAGHTIPRFAAGAIATFLRQF